MFDVGQQGVRRQCSGMRTLPSSAASAVLAICTLCWAVGAQAKPERASHEVLIGVVTYVTDGDTLWVKLAGHSHDDSVKVRFQGIDAPEICQPGGDASLATLKAKVLHQTVRLQTSRYDDYGRMLARVRMGHGAAGDDVRDDVGAWMVERGQAWSYRYRNSPGPYAAQEQVARAAKRGMWAVPGAVEPRVFRKQHGSCKP